LLSSSATTAPAPARDVELVTEHDSPGQLAGKNAAGRSRATGSARRGGTPFDPHYLEWLR
jgi:hypothetical protein